jgi:hypothetical protein
LIHQFSSSGISSDASYSSSRSISPPVQHFKEPHGDCGPGDGHRLGGESPIDISVAQNNVSARCRYHTRTPPPRGCRDRFDRKTKANCTQYRLQAANFRIASPRKRSIERGGVEIRSSGNLCDATSRLREVTQTLQQLSEIAVFEDRTKVVGGELRISPEALDRRFLVTSGYSRFHLDLAR